MPANNSAKYEVQVDVDVKTGRVNTSSLLDKLAVDVAKTLADLKTQNVNLPVDFDVTKSKQQLNKAYKDISEAISKESERVNKELSTKSPLAGPLRKALKEAGDTVTKDGKIVESKLREVLRNVSKELGKGKILSQNNPFKGFLDLSGKDLKSSLSQLENLTKVYKNTLINLALQGKKAAETNAKAHKQLDAAVKVSANNAAMSSQKESAAVASVIKTRNTAIGVGYKYARSFDEIAGKSAQATKSIRKYNEEVTKANLASFSSSLGFSQAKAKGARLRQVTGASNDSFAPKEAARSYGDLTLALSNAGKQFDATSLASSRLGKSLQLQRSGASAMAKGIRGLSKDLQDNAKSSDKEASSGNNLVKSLNRQTNAYRETTEALRKLNKEKKEAQLKAFGTAFGTTQAKRKAQFRTNNDSFAPKEAARSYGDLTLALSNAGKQFDATSLASSRLGKTLQLQRSGANAMAAGIDKISNASKKLKNNSPAKEVNSLTRSYEALQTANSKVKSSDTLSYKSQLRDLQQQEKALQSYIAELFRYRKQAKAARRDTDGFNKKIRESRAALAETEKALKGPKVALAEIGNSLRLFLRYAVAYRILNNVQQAITSVVKSIVSLEDALNSIQAVSAATSSEMVAVENAIKNVAITTKFTTEEIAEAAQTLAQAGVGPDDITSVLRGVADFAAATNASLSVAADLISTMRNVFKELDVEEIADKLTNAVNISKLTPTGLQTILSRLAQTVKSFKVNADEMFAAITVLKNVGIKDSTVSTGLRQGLLELLSPDEKTLKVLEKRYAALGQNLSKAAIRATFTGFQRADNPIVKVLDELEALGIRGSGREDFQRLFDIRAENVINALIDNKDQLIENQIAINQVGSAAKGAATRMESFSSSLSNLGATVSVLSFDLAGGILKDLTDISDSATEAIKSIREVLAEKKKLTGDTGQGTSLQVGAGVGATVFAQGQGIPKALLSGAVAYVLATFSTAKSGDGVIGAGITKVLDVIGTTATALGSLGVLTAIFGRGPLEGFAKASSTLLGKIKVFKRVFSGAGIAGLAKVFGLLGGVIGPLIVGLTTLFAIGDAVAGASLEEAVDALNARGEVLAKEADELKTQIGSLTSKIRTADKADAGLKNIKDKLEQSEQLLLKQVESAKKFSPEKTDIELRSDIQKFVDEVSQKVLDIGSDSFKGVRAQYAKQFGDISSKDLVTSAQGVRSNILQAEAARKIFSERIVAALEAPQSLGNAEIIAQYENLTAAQQAYYRTIITTSKRATEFFDVQESTFPDFSADAIKLKLANDQLLDKQLQQFQVLQDTVTLYEKELDKGLARRFLGKFQARLTDWGLFVQGLTETPTETLGQVIIDIGRATKGLKGSKGKLKAEILKAVEKGDTKFIEAVISRYGSLLKEVPGFIQEQLEAAKDNARVLFQKSIQDTINQLQKDARAPEKKQEKLPTTSIRTTEVIEEGIQKANVALRQSAVAEETSIRNELLQLLKDRKKLAETYAKDSKEILESNTKEKELKRNLVNAGIQVDGLTSTALKDTKKLKDLKSEQVFDEQELKEINKQLADVKKSELRNEEEFQNILGQRLEAEKTLLQAEEKALELAIKNALKRAGKGTGIEELNLTQLLDAIDVSGIALSGDLEGLGKLVKEGIGVRNRLNDAEERYTQDLDNYLRKEAKSALAKGERDLTKQHNKTVSLEAKLNRASDNLQKSRENLAKVYDKQADDERYFEQVRRGIAGEDDLQVGDAKNLINRARRAETTDESISLSKEANSVAKSLNSAGKLSKRSLKKIAEDAERLIKIARLAEIQKAEQEVARKQAELNQLAVQHAQSIQAEKSLEIAVNNLKTVMQNLPMQIAAALQSAGGTPTEGVLAEESKQPVAEIQWSADPDSLKTFEDFNTSKSPASVKGDPVAEIRWSIGPPNPKTQESLAVLERYPGYAEGGLVQGAGGPKDDRAGLFRLANREFVQPAAATEKYGTDFMEQIRSLRLSAASVRAVATPGNFVQAGGRAVKSGASAVARAVSSRTSGSNDLRPVTLNIGQASLSGKATDFSIATFKKELSLQALKEGKR